MRRTMQTQLRATTPPLVASLTVSFSFSVLRLPRSSFFVFVFLSISRVVRSSSFFDSEKARSRHLCPSPVLFGQFLVLYQVAAWNAGVLRSLRAASNR